MTLDLRSLGVWAARGNLQAGRGPLHRLDDEACCHREHSSNLSTDLQTAGVYDDHTLCADCTWPAHADELLETYGMDRLFVPLHSEHFYAFGYRGKTWELRGVNDQFNDDTVRVGRPVELRRGYNTPDSLWGEIANKRHHDTLEEIDYYDEITPGASREAFLKSARALLADYDHYLAFYIPDPSTDPPADH